MSDIQKLSARHMRILQLYLLGHKQVEIAGRLDMSQTQISNIINSPSFQYQAAQRREVLEEKMDDAQVHNDIEVSNTIKLHTMQAVQRLVAEMDGSVAGDRIRASTEILDRGGFPRVQRTESRSISVNIDADMAQLIASTVKMEEAG